MGKPNIVKLPVLDTLTFRITGIIGGNYIRIFFGGNVASEFRWKQITVNN